MTEARRSADHAAGFTLLEVMVSIAILALALVALLGIATNNVRATNHAKLTTAATFLARAKIAEIEDNLQYEGFSETDAEDAGDFAAEGYPQFSWTSLVEKVELPTEAVQQVQQAASDKSIEATNPLEAMAGFMGGFMGMLIEPLRVGLENSVRRVTVTVTWDEVGRGPQSMEVSAFFTDPSRIDQTMPTVTGGAGGASGGAAIGQTGQTGRGGAPGGATPSGGGMRR